MSLGRNVIVTANIHCFVCVSVFSYFRISFVSNFLMFFWAFSFQRGIVLVISVSGVKGKTSLGKFCQNATKQAVTSCNVRQPRVEKGEVARFNNADIYT